MTIIITMIILEMTWLCGAFSIMYFTFYFLHEILMF